MQVMRHLGSFLSSKQFYVIRQTLDDIESSETMQELIQRFDGLDAQGAYRELRNLSDYELKVLATLIGRVNERRNPI